MVLMSRNQEGRLVRRGEGKKMLQSINRKIKHREEVLLTAVGQKWELSVCGSFLLSNGTKREYLPLMLPGVHSCTLRALTKSNNR